MKIITKIVRKILGLLDYLIVKLPDEFTFVRRLYYNYKGSKIDEFTSISNNVIIKGKIEMGYGSSIAQNCSIASEHSGVVIGKNVMMAPNAVIVDFNHGFSSTKIPMVIQSNESKKVIIEDDVWIASNCTIGKGVKIGRGSIISANSLVNKDVDPFSIFGGVPAKLIKHRS